MTALADPEVADLRARVRLELDSVFPATTACAMTTVATGRWPAQHGVPGWWAYLAEHDLSATVLPFLERHSGRKLRRYGVQAAEIWPLPSRFAEVTGNMQVHVPLVYLLSTFNRYLSGRCATRGYRSLRQAQRRIMRRLRSVSRRGAAPTITYWYIPDYDSACHTYGVASTQARGTLRHIQALLLELAATAPDDALVAVTADHGLIDLTEGDRAPLFQGDPLLDCLRCAPTGEGRTPHFHVRPGKEAELVQRVADLAGDRLALLSQGEAEELRLFGPEPLSPSRPPPLRRLHRSRARPIHPRLLRIRRCHLVAPHRRPRRHVPRGGPHPPRHTLSPPCSDAGAMRHRKAHRGRQRGRSPADPVPYGGDGPSPCAW